MSTEVIVNANLNDSQTNAILESISDGVFTVEHDWLITSFNRAAEEITGISRSEAIGRPCCEVFKADACESACPLRHTLNTGTPVINRTAFIISTDGKRIPISISTALFRDSTGNTIGGAESFRDLSVEEALRRKTKFDSADIISHSPAMQHIFSILPDVAESDSSVLIQGETGTGKELLARAIHQQSPRRNKPFIAVNCGALPDNLLESELFGYRKGAFTDAKQDKPGRFALAEGGTLFLDEIGDLSPAMQVKLLRVLQEKTYDPLGATASVKADVRVLSATHRNLETMQAEGNFRNDLYYRLNVIRLLLPPLRERSEDIPLLADVFIDRFNLTRNKHLDGLSETTLNYLMVYPFPGNIRELENMIEHAFILCSGGLIEPQHLPMTLSSQPQSAPPPSNSSLAASKNTAERQRIETTLQANNNNRAATARALGIHKATLYRKLKRLGISTD